LRKKLLVVSIAGFLLTGATGLTSLPSSAKAETIATSLSQGMTSPSVTELQKQLQALGIFTYPTATGYYGTITFAAVKSFQQMYSLPATGIADISTRASISRAIVKKQMLADSMKLLHTPYQWGGISPSTGFDCSGFVYYMFTTHGVAMSRTSSTNLYTKGTPVARQALQPGDLVFFSINMTGTVDHVGFYMGDGQFISVTRSAGVYPQKLDNSYWGPRYLGAKRVY
jgi:cell wall-associated NlpC family hydrolase